MIRRIRAGSGLGDSLYLRPICDHFVRQGDTVVALSDYAPIFFGSGATVEPFRRHSFDIAAHYVGRKNDRTTNQWQDVCIAAHLKEPLPLTMPWAVRNTALTSEVRRQAQGRRIVLVHGGREPMARQDQFARELLPTGAALNTTLAALSDAFLVGIGKGPTLYPVPVDLDLRDQTTVSDLLDLAVTCHGLVGQCSYIIPLAEIFDKPLLVIWAARGLESRETYIRTITPQKILSKPSSTFAMDDWPAERIEHAARVFAGAERAAA